MGLIDKLFDKNTQTDPIPQETEPPQAKPQPAAKENKMAECLTPCLLNPGSGEVIARANMVQDTLSHSTQRGIRNADAFDKYLDSMLLHDAKFASTMENLATAFATLANDSAVNENQATQQNSDTAKKVVEASVTTAAVTLGNIATAVAPLLVGASGTVSVQTLAAALPAVIAAAQAAASASTKSAA